VHHSTGRCGPKIPGLLSLHISILVASYRFQVCPLLPMMLDSPSHFQAELDTTKDEKQIGKLAPDVPIITLAASDDLNEPIVTRKELWSYYCTFPVLALP